MEAVARPASAHGACAWQQSCLRAPGVAPERKGRAAARVSETRRHFYSPLETRRTIFTGCATFVGRLSASRQVRAGAGREELLTALVSLATSQRTQGATPLCRRNHPDSGPCSGRAPHDADSCSKNTDKQTRMIHLRIRHCDHQHQNRNQRREVAHTAIGIASVDVRLRESQATLTDPGVHVWKHMIRAA